MKKKWLDNHELFYSELLKGVKYQKIVEQKISECGIVVNHAKFCYDFDLNADESQYPEWMKSRKDIESTRREYSENEEDIIIGKNKILCECKSRDLNFLDVLSFPFPDIFIDTIHGYEKKKNKPAYTFCISQKTKAIIYLDTSPENKHKWQKKSIFDKKRGISETNYCASKNLWKDFVNFKEDFIIKYESKLDAFDF